MTLEIIAFAALSTGLSFLFLLAVFLPIEWAFPAKPRQGFMRPAWWTDLLFFLGQNLFWAGLVFWVLIHFGRWIDVTMPSSFRSAVASQPWWLQVMEVVLLSDFFVYWGHRLQHNVGFLWRFHSIHHSAKHLDWLAAHREHPIDTVYTMGLINLPVFLLGFPVETLAGLVAFRGVWAIYIHSNVRLPIGPLRWFVGAPELHHWHHDKDRRAGNYANISPLMDILFGTYKCPDHEPEAFGIHEPIAKSYVGQMLHPFWPKKEHDEEHPEAVDRGFEVIVAGCEKEAPAKDCVVKNQAQAQTPSPQPWPDENLDVVHPAFVARTKNSGDFEAISRV